MDDEGVTVVRVHNRLYTPSHRLQHIFLRTRRWRGWCKHASSIQRGDSP